jgi:16S rRNA (uracil1498-N3)-methyltransferase
MTFHIAPEQIKDKTITVTGKDVHHIKNVLRMKPGDELSLSDGSALLYCAAISAVSDEAIECELLYIRESGLELLAQIHLFQSLPKAGKMELVIQKAVELGVSQIIPLAAARSVVRLNHEKGKEKTKRWQAVSEAAAKQCGRLLVPPVHDILSFSDALQLAAPMAVRIIPYELAAQTGNDMAKTREIIKNIEAGQQVAVFIGPEGGFTPAEISLAIEAGAVPITLGKRILRTETAGMVVASWIMYELEKYLWKLVVEFILIMPPLPAAFLRWRS